MLITVGWALGIQLGVIAVSALLAGWWGGMGVGVAVISGGVIALANTALLMWRWHQGSDKFHCDADRHLRAFYRSSLERFFVVGILLAVGFLLLKSEPLAILAGFVVGQLAWMIASLALRERT
jgi:F0F1-type ATP synthase assembly protein I